MSPQTELLLTSLLVVLATMTLLCLVSLLRRDASIVDPFWGIGFVLVAWCSLWYFPSAQSDSRAWLLTVLTTIWGTRLSLHLLWRNLGHGEDRRYRAMREHHGPRFWWVSLLTVFWLQAVILWLVSMPIQAAIASAANLQSVIAEGSALADASGFNPFDLLGLVVWSIGLFFEAVGDFQMAKFQRDPANAGRVMNRGHWRYTRHPNYYGDFCIWWRLYLIAAGAEASWTIFSPLLMSFLLLKVSGVTLLEKTISDRRPEYHEYQYQTNAFFPGPSRKRR